MCGNRGAGRGSIYSVSVSRLSRRYCGTLGFICFQLLVLAGRNILFQTAEEKAEFHVGRNVTNPHVHAGFQFIKMFFELGSPDVP